ncbi:DUF6758 family protein [Motilibacter aurantiacus]|uniref:DUF6758 family protein n=1 Tax=Motilibacter aurantiacus TaxID=2714955 RepID=UPI00140C8692|nr:DUF6758 family protein [Motilibacter aurantiacus]NHC45683.1 hypothetical protein [Motilibacter aurantiacus]
MKGEPSCPRCGGAVQPPGLWSSGWACSLHGAVLPQQPVVQPTVEVVADVVRRSRVPVWLPWPLPHAWVVTGVSWAGDDRTGARAVAVSASGPAPLGGMGELLLVAEEPGLGLGARYAGMPGPDPGSLPDGRPAAKVDAAGHPTALWCVSGDERCAAYVGEALGHWLYVLLWPESAGALLLEGLRLADARDLGHEIELLPVGALTPRLAAAPVTSAGPGPRG